MNVESSDSLGETGQADHTVSVFALLLPFRTTRANPFRWADTVTVILESLLQEWGITGMITNIYHVLTVHFLTALYVFVI